MTTLTYFTLSFALTLWLSRFLLTYMDPSFFMDHPSERKIHTRPKPRFGGLAFSPIIIILGWFLLNGDGHLTWYFLGALSMFVLGAIDDYWTITWHYKLPVQIAVGVLVVIQFVNDITNVSLFSLTLPFTQLALIILFIIWFVGILNALNLIDGMDGLAGGYVFLTAFGCVILGWLTHSMQFIYLNVIIMGAMIAFLHFNQKPSKFFMGDSGSLFLGFHIATLPLQYIAFSKGTGTLDITPFVLLASYLIIDTLRVFYTRIVHNKHPLEPDQSHMHHIMLKASNSYNGTLLTIFFLLGLSGTAAITYAINPFNILFLIVYFIFVFIFVLVPKILDLMVIALTRLIHSFKRTDLQYEPMRLILRVRYLPFITVLYFGGLLLMTPQFNQINTISFLLIVSSIFIVTYIFSGQNIQYKSELIIIGIGITQTVLLFKLYDSGTHISIDSLDDIGNVLRYISLIFIAVVTFMNYILHGKRIPSEFWSATDLLIMIILFGIASIQTIGFGIPVLMSFELGIIYLSNKLYIPRILMGSLAAQSQKA